MSAQKLSPSGLHRSLPVTGGLVVAMAVSAVACSSSIVSEVIPRRAVVTPVLVMEVDLGSEEAQTASFSFKYPGQYSVNADLELRHGPQGVRIDHKEFRLAGTAEIIEASGGLILEKTFEHAVPDNVVRVKLFEFDTDQAGMDGEKRFRLSIDVEPEFRSHDSRMTLFIRKELAYPIVD